MYEPDSHNSHSHRSRRGGGNVASCIVATLFLLFLAGVGVGVSFLLLKPKEPKIAVTAVQFPKLSVSNGTFNLTFFQLVSVTNPNRDSFSHYDSSLQLLYSGAQLGVVAIPAGQIAAGRTQRMSAKFEVQGYPVGAAAASTSTMELEIEIETRMKLVGRVRVLNVFMHRVESGVRCSVGIKGHTIKEVNFAIDWRNCCTPMSQDNLYPKIL